MPRIARGETVGGIYHIINRGNMQMQVFDDKEDYEYFLELLEIGTKNWNKKRKSRDTCLLSHAKSFPSVACTPRRKKFK